MPVVSRHVLVSRISALGTGPVSPDYLDKHQLHGISLERIRRDRSLHEALATGAGPLHLALVSTSTTPTRWPTPTPPATFSAARPNKHCHTFRNNKGSTPSTRAGAGRWPSPMMSTGRRRQPDTWDGEYLAGDNALCRRSLSPAIQDRENRHLPGS
jgi:hypothetical protein